MAGDVRLKLSLDDEGRVQLQGVAKQYGQELDKMKQKTASVSDDIRAQFAKTQAMIDATNRRFNTLSFSRISSDIKTMAINVGNSITTMATGAMAELRRIGPMVMATVGIAGVGGFGMLAKGMVSARMELEKYTTEFEVLFKSKERATEVMNMVVAFAAKTPFQLPEVIQATRILETLTKGALSTVEGLKMVGDAASGVGVRINELAMWFGRLYDGIKSGRPVGEATMRMQEMGLMSGEVRNKIEAMQKSGRSGAEVWKMASESFGRYSGMMEQKSHTLEGVLSNIQDAWWRMKTVIADRVFPEIKKTSVDIMQSLEDMISNGTAERLGEAFSSVFNVIKNGILFIKDNWSTIRDILTIGAVVLTVVKGVALLSNPLVQAIALSAALVKTWQALSGSGGSVMSSVFGAFEGLALLIEKLRLNVAYLIDKFKQLAGEDTATKLSNQIKAKQEDLNKLQALRGTFGQVDPALIAKAQAELLRMKRGLEERLARGEEVVPTTGEEIIKQAEANVKHFKDALTGVKEFTQKDIIDYMESSAKELRSRVTDQVKGLADDMKDNANKIKETLMKMIPVGVKDKIGPIAKATGDIRSSQNLEVPGIPTAFGTTGSVRVPVANDLIGAQQAKQTGEQQAAQVSDAYNRAINKSFQTGVEQALNQNYTMPALLENYGRDMASAFHEGFSSSLVALMSGGKEIKNALKSFADEMSSLSKRFVADTMTTQIDNWVKQMGPKMAGMVAGIAQTASAVIEGGSNAGSAIGSGLGMIAGSFLGPGGTVLGGMAGGLLGGLFDRDEKTRDDIAKTADNTSQMAQQLEVVNRNLIGLRQQMEPYPLPSSAYFSNRRTEEQLALEASIA